MLNIGIDFGSTYTIASIYRSDTKKLEPIILGTGTPYIPSVVACKDDNLGGKVLYGERAKRSSSKNGFYVYKAFKMLLTEREGEVLRKRGYSKTVSPYRVTEEFLCYLVKRICDNCKENHIDNLVIGAPEIWFKGVNTISGRGILMEICEGIDGVKNVQVVSEPAAACAYFAYNYNQIAGKPYEGNILLIDYGGGTLDISLTEISSQFNTKGHQSMEIKVIEQNGAGENQGEQIGKAGIVYMESVILEAIKRAKVYKNGEAVPLDNEFYAAVDELESVLQAEKCEIDDTFMDYGIDDLKELGDCLEIINYKDVKLNITYALLVEVYNKVIRGIFQEKLDEMKKFMKKRNIDFMSSRNVSFKIALVGGFGNYYLVRNQVEETFKFTSLDTRRKDIIVHETDCENAISLGTALLASGIIGIKQTAPYSIGILQYDMNGKCVIDYAIKYKQDIISDEKYYHKDTDGTHSKFYISEGRINSVVINSSHDDKNAIVLPFKKEFRDKLSNLVSSRLPIAAIGFSLDSSEILTIWVQEHNGYQGIKEPKSIPLGRFDEMFETSKITRVRDING